MAFAEWELPNDEVAMLGREYEEIRSRKSVEYKPYPVDNRKKRHENVSAEEVNKRETV